MLRLWFLLMIKQSLFFLYVFFLIVKNKKLGNYSMCSWIWRLKILFIKISNIPITTPSYVHKKHYVLLIRKKQCKWSHTYIIDLNLNIMKHEQIYVTENKIRSTFIIYRWIVRFHLA